MSNLSAGPVTLRHTLLYLTLGLGVPAAALAQVGHDPQSSPYRDVPEKYIISFTGGYSWASGGKVNVGPGEGAVFGARGDVHLAGPGMVHIGVNFGNLDRLLLDPTKPPEERVLGWTTQTVMMADVGLNLVLTGQKSWYGIAPFIGASIGIAIGGDVPADSLSGYEFNTKFIVTPAIGIRWHPIRRIGLRVEFRDVLWKLSYPNSFFEPPTEDPGIPPVLDPDFNKATDWTHNPSLYVSLGFAFGR